MYKYVLCTSNPLKVSALDKALLEFHGSEKYEIIPLPSPGPDGWNKSLGFPETPWDGNILRSAIKRIDYAFQANLAVFDPYGEDVKFIAIESGITLNPNIGQASHLTLAVCHGHVGFSFNVKIPTDLYFKNQYTAGTNKLYSFYPKESGFTKDTDPVAFFSKNRFTRAQEVESACQDLLEKFR